MCDNYRFIDCSAVIARLDGVYKLNGEYCVLLIAEIIASCCVIGFLQAP